MQKKARLAEEQRKRATKSLHPSSIGIAAELGQLRKDKDGDLVVEVVPGLEVPEETNYKRLI